MDSLIQRKGPEHKTAVHTPPQTRPGVRTPQSQHVLTRAKVETRTPSHACTKLRGTGGGRLPMEINFLEGMTQNF